MSILFMGTPEWAIPSLDAVLNSPHPVAAVFTQPDRPVGRKRQLTPSPLKKYAQELGLEIHNPEKAGSPESLELVKKIAPELIIVCAYGQILPQAFLDIPKIGCFNMHFSFLPCWRGASPVQAAIASGDETTGVSLQKMVFKLDAGPLVATSAAETILKDDTTASLGSRLAEMGGQMILQTIPKLFDGQISAVAQDENQATYCRIIKKEEGQINWKQESAVVIERKLRAYSPWPGIFSTFNTEEPTHSLSGKRMQFTKVEIVEGDFEPGKIYPEWVIGTASGGLKVLKLKPAGKQEMEASAHLRGQQQILEMVLE